MKNYLEGLNEPQKAAVLHTEGPLLIIAGAGAGKTKTITHRIAHLIAQGVPPRQVLAVTFTNKAAGEMRERVRTLVPEGKGAPLLATFHSLGVRLLREFSEQAGVPRNFAIWDRDDSTRALKRILDDSSVTPRDALSRISRAKGMGLSAGEFASRAQSYREKDIAAAWEKYEKTLSEEGALDFDDLLSRPLKLLRERKDVLELLQQRWTHITIDEYQDCSASQYEIARLLAGERRNLCVVGDTDQNIYSWRGADIEHLLGFEGQFPGARVILLEQNYRSTRTILSAANAVIEKNARRKPKTLFTENETGDAISLFPAQNEMEESWFVAAKCQELIERGVRPSEIAVLYRENFQSRALEEALLHFGVPYRVLGTRFFERKEVKDVLSYLRASLNEKSSVDLARAAATPSRGIGKTTLEKARATGIESLSGAARTKMLAFRELLARIKQAIDTVPASDAVRFAVEASGMEEMYKKDAEEGGERLENIHELVNLSTRYDYAEPPAGIEQLLEEAALQSDQDELRDEIAAVSLMTVHASKGLEFDAVFITGLEQGLFPHNVDAGTRDPEEERRLFYVALTRARKRLFLTFAAERMKYGSREGALPSEFLGDIDERLVEYVERGKRRSDDEYEKVIR